MRLGESILVPLKVQSLARLDFDFFPPFFAQVTFVNSESAFFRIRAILQGDVCKKLNQEIVSNEVVFWHFKRRKRI